MIDYQSPIKRPDLPYVNPFPATTPQPTVAPDTQPVVPDYLKEFLANQDYSQQDALNNQADQIQQGAYAPQENRKLNPLAFVVGLLGALADRTGKFSAGFQPGLGSAIQQGQQTDQQNQELARQQKIAESNALRNHAVVLDARRKAYGDAAIQAAKLQQDQSQFTQDQTLKKYGIDKTLQGREYTADAGLSKEQLKSKQKTKDRSWGMILNPKSLLEDRLNAIDQLEAMGEAVPQAVKDRAAIVSDFEQNLQGKTRKDTATTDKTKEETINLRTFRPLTVEKMKAEIDDIKKRARVSKERADQIAKALTFADDQEKDRHILAVAKANNLNDMIKKRTANGGNTKGAQKLLEDQIGSLYAQAKQEGEAFDTLQPEWTAYKKLGDEKSAKYTFDQMQAHEQAKAAALKEAKELSRTLVSIPPDPDDPVDPSIRKALIVGGGTPRPKGALPAVDGAPDGFPKPSSLKPPGSNAVNKANQNRTPKGRTFSFGN